MSRITEHLSASTLFSCFSTGTGWEEAFIATTSTPDSSCVDALTEIEKEYAAACDAKGLSDQTAAFSRLFVSDYVNQQAILEKSALVKRLSRGACSIIEQKPVGSGPFSLFSYHVRNQNGNAVPKTAAGDGTFGCIRGKRYSLLFTANDAGEEAFDAYAQTGALFKTLKGTLDRNGMTLAGNTIRTWIFVHDVDNHYQNMVRARREFFTEHGLTDKTRYLASTGIEGCGRSPSRLVIMDSLSIGGLEAGQIVRMEAPGNLSPTILYGVTFERGLRVRFGDRSHLYISGTASINAKGEVLHTGDMEQQARRTFENVRALLNGHKAVMADLAYCIIYVRNRHEWAIAKRVIQKEIGRDIPLLAVEARVCRPAWLFEIEGMAIVPDSNGYPPLE